MEELATHPKVIDEKTHDDLRHHVGESLLDDVEVGRDKRLDHLDLNPTHTPRGGMGEVHSQGGGRKSHASTSQLR